MHLCLIHIVYDWWNVFFYCRSPSQEGESWLGQVTYHTIEYNAILLIGKFGELHITCVSVSRYLGALIPLRWDKFKVRGRLAGKTDGASVAGTQDILSEEKEQNLVKEDIADLPKDDQGNITDKLDTNSRRLSHSHSEATLLDNSLEVWIDYNHKWWLQVKSNALTRPRLRNTAHTVKSLTSTTLNLFCSLR